jgi:hypothetical protein
MGTVALVGMRAFDERYASMTIADPRTDSLDALSLWLRIGRGVLAGAVYGELRRRALGASALRDGVALGAATYMAGALTSMLLSQRHAPIWAQPFPVIVGEWLRHAAYGVTTAATFSALRESDLRVRRQSSRATVVGATSTRRTARGLTLGAGRHAMGIGVR